MKNVLKTIAEKRIILKQNVRKKKYRKDGKMRREIKRDVDFVLDNDKEEK